MIRDGIPVEFVLSRGRSGSIRCIPGERVIVRMPRGLSEERVMKVLDKHWPKLLHRYKKVPPSFLQIPSVWSAGERIGVLGEVWTLSDGAFRTDAVGRTVFVSGSVTERREQLRRWIQEKVAQEALILAKEFADRLDVTFQRLDVCHYATRLGCCIRRTRLRFHWGIGLLTPELFRTIVAHEVAHLKCNGHQADFWQTLGELEPGYRENHKVIRAVGSRLKF